MRDNDWVDPEMGNRTEQQRLLVSSMRVTKLLVWPQNIAFTLNTKLSGAIIIKAQKQR